MYGLNSLGLNSLSNPTELLKKCGLNETEINALGGSIFDIAALHQTDNYQQKGVIVQDLVQKVMSFLGSIATGTGEAKEAREESKKESKELKALEKESEKLNVKLKGSFEEVASDIEAKKEIIEKAQDKLKETEQKTKEKQEKMAEYIKQIQQKQQELAQCTDPEKQKTLLSDIQAFAKEIASIGLTLEEDNENITTLCEVVDNTAENVSEATSKMTVIVEDGQAQIGKLSKKTVREVGDVAKTGQKATQNQVTGEALEKAATTGNIVPGGQAASAKVMRSAIDNKTAAQVRVSAIGTHMNDIKACIGTLSNGQQILKEFEGTIGSAINAYTGAFGDWESKINPFLEGFGTMIAGLGKDGDFAKLNTAVEKDLKTIDNNSKKVETKKTETDETTEKASDVEETPATEEVTSETSNNEQKNNLETPKVDLKGFSELLKQKK